VLLTLSGDVLRRVPLGALDLVGAEPSVEQPPAVSADVDPSIERRASGVVDLALRQV
jgi:hypothetical protein